MSERESIMHVHKLHLQKSTGMEEKKKGFLTRGEPLPFQVPCRNHSCMRVNCNAIEDAYTSVNAHRQLRYSWCLWSTRERRSLIIPDNHKLFKGSAKRKISRRYRRLIERWPFLRCHEYRERKLWKVGRFEDWVGSGTRYLKVAHTVVGSYSTSGLSTGR